MTFLSAPLLSEITRRLGLVLGGLRAAVAARAGRDRTVVQIVLLVWARTARVRRRFEAVLAKLEAGRPTGRPVRQRAAGDRAARATATATLRLPSRPGWLGQLIPEARAYGSQLEALLAAPDMAALLAAAPAARQALLPLCRMLGVAMPEPAAPTVARAARRTDHPIRAPWPSWPAAGGLARAFGLPHLPAWRGG